MQIKLNALQIIGLSILLLCVLFVLSLCLGSVDIPLQQVWAALWLNDNEAPTIIIRDIRLPRALMGVVIGIILALSGVAMQSLFRNPLADPGLMGVSSGAALGSALVIVMSTSLNQTSPSSLLMLISAFVGGLCSSWIVYRLGYRNGFLQINTLLLAGVALTTLTGAVISLFTYIADSRALRALTFWNMGTLNAVSFSYLWLLSLVALLIFVWMLRNANALNALLLGESEAYHIGFPVESLKKRIILITALGVGCAVATTGLIGFIGLMVPHIARLIIGPNHRVLVPLSAILGALLLLSSDLLARLLLKPIEIPIGIITATLGAPFFLYLLVRKS